MHEVVNTGPARWWSEGSHRENLEIRWIGQAGFLIRFRHLRIVVDPYLSDSLAEKYRGHELPHARLIPAPIAPTDLTNTDLVLCTHEHGDHMDAETLTGVLRVSPQAMVVIPRFSMSKALRKGVPANRLVALSAGETWTSSTGAQICATPAAHEEFVADAAENSKFLGYVLRMGPFAVYHSGDTIPYADLEETLARQGEIEVALLPANGRDKLRESRGIPGNFTAEEALEYHCRFHFRYTILHHFEMFEFNTAEREVLSQLVTRKDLAHSVAIPSLGTTYRFVDNHHTT